MTEPRPTLRACRNLKENIRKAIAEARAAYEFAPNSYTYSCLGACLAAEVALGVLLESLPDIEGSIA
jgi:hypothetical protein